MTDRVSFGLWLKQRRVGLGLTQAELAACASCSVALIRKIESDERRPSIQVAELLASCLQVTPDERAGFLAAARAKQRLIDRPAVTVPAIEGGGAWLPSAATPLVGRAVELREVGALLREPDCKLVTLVGPGGVGKTRLALAVAEQEAGRFTDGARFVSLAALGDCELIASALAEGLGVLLAGATDAVAQLVEALRDKRLLLVVDNVEHLLQGVETLTTLLAQAPGLTVVATSRERLNVQGEWVFEVRGLLTPPAVLGRGTANVGEAANYDAVQLFVNSARRTAGDFRLDADNVGAVVRICQLMEGFPLGIELAAAWVHVLDCAEIAQEIEGSLDFGVEGSDARRRDLPQRQRSLRAAFDYSWNLSSEAEQEALRRLSLFEGGFTRQAAEAAGVRLGLLAALVDKSLVRREEGGRYGQHGLIRQYAAERLREAGEERARAAMEHYAQYFLGLLQERTAALTSAAQAETLAALDAEIDNIRSAWKAAAELGRLDWMQQAAWTLYYYFELRNHFEEGETLFGQAAARSGMVDLGMRGLVLESEWLFEQGEMMVHEAFFAFRRGRIQGARLQYERAMQMMDIGAMFLDANGGQFARAHGWLHLGYMCWIGGDLEAAEDSIERGLPLSEALGNGWLEANYAAARGALAHERGDYEGAYAFLRASVQRAQMMGDPHLISFCGNLLARTALAVGRTEAFHDLAVKQLGRQETGDRWSEGLQLERRAAAAMAGGDIAEAQRLYKEAAGLYEEIEDHWSLARAWNLLGNAALALADVSLARESYVAAGHAAWRVQAMLLLLDALAGLAELAAHEGCEGEAQELGWHVANHPAATKELRERMADIKVCCKRGRPFEQVVREALRLGD